MNSGPSSEPGRSPKDPAGDTPRDFLRHARLNGVGVFDALVPSVETFQALRGQTADQIREKFQALDSLPGEERRLLELLREISSLTQDGMKMMNEAHPGLPPDSLETTLGLVTRPGASVAVLRGSATADLRNPDEVLGYGIVIRGKENFPEHEAPDLAHRIPEELFGGSPVHHRLIRLFVRDCAREQEGPGRAFDKIIDTIKEICGDEPIIGMVLTDLSPLDESPPNPDGKRIWLEAMHALKRRGFEDAGHGLNEIIAAPNKPVIQIPFRWWMYPPRTESGRQEYEGLQTRYRELEVKQQRRLAGIIGQLPLTGAHVHFVGSHADGGALSITSGNEVFLEAVPSSDPRSNRSLRRPNLSSVDWKSGLSLPPSSADAVVINGVLPDIAQGATDPRGAIRAFTEKRAELLAPGGILLIRDTVLASDRAPVHLYLDAIKPLDKTDGKTLTRLFEEFVASPREVSVHPEEWLQVQRLNDVGARACFYVPASIAEEFRLKYAYYQDWSRERDRAYTLHSIEDRLELGAGLRLVCAVPERNAFIGNQDRTAGISMTTPSGRHLDPSPSNHVTVWQRVGPDEGVRITPGQELPVKIPAPFVSITRYESVNSLGEVTAVREIADRKGVTHDVIPFQLDKERLYVIARVMPRPLTTLHQSLDGAIHGGYQAEQLAAIVDDPTSPDEDLTQTVLSVFENVTGMCQARTPRVANQSRYFVLPDTVAEEVVASTVELQGFPLYETFVSAPSLAFGSHYTIRAFDAVRILQGQQVGHSQDARLERKVYELLDQYELSKGPWIGETISPEPQDLGNIEICGSAGIINPPVRQAFRRASDQTPRFLKAYRREFIEHIGGDQPTQRTRALEYVEPAPSTGLSHQSLSILPFAQVLLPNGSKEIVVGIEIKDLPAAQEKTDSSALATIPFVRIPKRAQNLHEATSYGEEMLFRQFGISCRSISSLGGKYVASPGITPETIYPYIVEVDLAKSRHESLQWVSLRELLPHVSKLQCGQIVTSLYRAAHMLEGMAR